MQEAATVRDAARAADAVWRAGGGAAMKARSQVTAQATNVHPRARLFQNLIPVDSSNTTTSRNGSYKDGYSNAGGDEGGGAVFGGGGFGKPAVVAMVPRAKKILNPQWLESRDLQPPAPDEDKPDNLEVDTISIPYPTLTYQPVSVLESLAVAHAAATSAAKEGGARASTDAAAESAGGGGAAAAAAGRRGASAVPAPAHSGAWPSTTAAGGGGGSGGWGARVGAGSTRGTAAAAGQALGGGGTLGVAGAGVAAASAAAAWSGPFQAQLSVTSFALNMDDARRRMRCAEPITRADFFGESDGEGE
ncbi:hypothetical protein DFJ73DRAFT_960206 [Zopfochytrium polystomum]|nr:hypothetical protein DFJ73DRAFT_960206 [Zopfochytrium polystomum]